MGKYYWQLYANYQAFGRLFKTIILWQVCKLHSYASNVELFIILYWYIYVALYWNILLRIFRVFLVCLFLCLCFSLNFVLTPSLGVGTADWVTGPEGVNFHRQHNHLCLASWRPPSMQAKIRCHFVIIRLPWRPVYILSFQTLPILCLKSCILLP